jgi:hypothetical protein
MESFKTIFTGILNGSLISLHQNQKQPEKEMK